MIRKGVDNVDSIGTHNIKKTDAGTAGGGGVNEIPVIQPQHEKRTYTVDEVQSILEISKTTAYALVRSSVFKSINVGRHIRISKKSFDDWLDNQG